MSKSPERPNVRMRIIVADDEPLIATTLVEILGIGGFDAEAVSDELLRLSGPEPFVRTSCSAMFRCPT
jgi:CheY-like chemotaxis protein